MKPEDIQFTETGHIDFAKAELKHAEELSKQAVQSWVNEFFNKSETDLDALYEFYTRKSENQHKKFIRSSILLFLVNISFFLLNLYWFMQIVGN